MSFNNWKIMILDDGISDIYVSVVSYTHQIASKGYFMAIVSTMVETGNPEAEIQPGIDLLGPIEQK